MQGGCKYRVQLLLTISDYYTITHYYVKYLERGSRLCVCVWGGGGGAEQQEASEKLTRIIADAGGIIAEGVGAVLLQLQGDQWRAVSQLHDTGLLPELVTFHITYHISVPSSENRSTCFP